MKILKGKLKTRLIELSLVMLTLFIGIVVNFFENM